jgi:hypothetical protein
MVDDGVCHSDTAGHGPYLVIVRQLTADSRTDSRTSLYSVSRCTQVALAAKNPVFA